MNFLTLFTKPNLIAAHRGDRSIQPENTMASLRSSVGKCDFIEIDVQLSKDMVPVILHDDTLERTSNVKAVFHNRTPWYVNEFTLLELEKLDLGSWFNGVYEPILTLRQALMFAVEEKQYLNIEVKDMSEIADDEEVMRIILDEIKHSGAEALVIISSFYHPYLLLSKKLASLIPTAALQEDKREDMVKYMHALNVDACNLDDVITDEHTVRRLREAGFAVNVYTVNNPQRMKELFKWGVNAVFTDVPDQDLLKDRTS